MKYLIYMSSAIKLMSDDELLELLTVSRENNIKTGVTGMLLYGEGAFVQVLEGPAAEVDKLFATIQTDTRHKKIILLISGALAHRNFADWTMGFKTVNMDVVKEFKGFIDVRTDGHLITDELHPAITVLKTFANANNMI